VCLQAVGLLEESRVGELKQTLPQHLAMLRKENPNVASRNSNRAELEDDATDDGVYRSI
jgi:hypothetical protein